MKTFIVIIVVLSSLPLARADDPVGKNKVILETSGSDVYIPPTVKNGRIVRESDQYVQAPTVTWNSDSTQLAVSPDELNILNYQKQSTAKLVFPSSTGNPNCDDITFDKPEQATRFESLMQQDSYLQIRINTLPRNAFAGRGCAHQFQASEVMIKTSPKDTQEICLQKWIAEATPDQALAIAMSSNPNGVKSAVVGSQEAQPQRKTLSMPSTATVAKEFALFFAGKFEASLLKKRGL